MFLTLDEKSTFTPPLNMIWTNSVYFNAYVEFLMVATKRSLLAKTTQLRINFSRHIQTIVVFHFSYKQRTYIHACIYIYIYIYREREREREVPPGFWWVDIRDGDHLEDTGADRRIILKWSFKKRDGGMDWIDLAQDRDR
jgi:hypothetical protein